MNLKSKRILITGSDGFIGSHLVERFLNEDCQIRAFVYYNSFNTWGWLDNLPKNDLKKIDVVSGDIRDADFVRSTVKDIDIICHLAALISIPYSYVAPESFVETNVNGTLNIIQAAKDYNVNKVLITSTSETYGSALYTPIDEKHPYQPQSPYSATKIAADHIAMSFYYSFNLPITIIRPFNTYGPRQSSRAIIPTIITQILNKNKELKLGNLTPTRDLTYVEDTCEAYLKICKKDNLDGEVINIGSSNEISIKTLVEKIKKLMNSDIKVSTDNQRVRPSKSEVDRLYANIDKAKELIGWEPTISLENGLKRTIDWFRKKENIKTYKNIYNV